MAVPLPPTVHERLARCGERVFVDGLLAGATVELHVDGAVWTITSNGGSRNFVVPPLNPGAVVRARQDAGAGFTPFSASVIVENAVVPPEAAPTLPEEIDACSQCVFVNHATPGAGLELYVGDALVGTGAANRHGDACVSVDLRNWRVGGRLRGRQVVCGAGGPDVLRTLVSLLPLPAPVIGDPVFGCQSRIPISGARAGAVLAFETDGGANLGTVCSCWSAVNVNVIRPVAVGEQVRARCLYDSGHCDVTGTWSDWRLVAPPDERIKPEVLEALIDGDQVIRVANQIAGASLLVRIALMQGAAPEEFGPRDASVEQEIGLSFPLVAGNVVTVIQTLCGFSMESDPVTVQPKPPVIFAPVLVPPMYMCGQAVQVSNLHPGAVVRVFLDDVPIGLRWAGLENSITVPVAPTLVAGRTVTAIQSVGGTPGPVSDGIGVIRLGDLPPPRMMGPLAFGDQAVWVSGVVPGAHVSIVSGGSIIGELDAAEPIVRVPIGPLAGAVTGATVRVRLCHLTTTGNSLAAVRSPCETYTDDEVNETTVELGDFAVPAVLDGGGFTIPLRGQLYTPGTPTQAQAPLVIIAHGYHTGWNQNTGEPVDSFKGYDYLAHHLVRWGMHVFSIDLREINDRSRTSTAMLQQFARAEIILRTISALQAVPGLGAAIDPARIGLVGHSMGGEAVVVAQFLNLTENRGAGIQGVVSIAPTRWHPQVVLPPGRYLQLFGSMDQLTSFIPSVDVRMASGGMRIYDRAERDKTLFWLYGMRHNPFNSLWVAAGDAGEAGLADLALPEAEHQLAAKCLVNAFFQDALFGEAVYRAYMEGTVFPQRVRHLEIHTSHSGQPRVVLDNFGDVDAQAALIAETPLNKTINSRNQVVNAAAIGTWEDEQHASIPKSPHSTAGVRLSWDGPAAEYRSDTGGIATAAEDVLAMRLAQFFTDTTLNPIAMPADLFVSLSDGTQHALVRLGAIAQIPYPDVGAYGRVLSMMRTVRLPMNAFRAANPALNLGDIRSVTLRFIARPSGHILADDFEFSQ